MDGATITLQSGILIATRGMGDDIMGGSTTMPDWGSEPLPLSYSKSLSYLRHDNKILTRNFDCKLSGVKKLKRSKYSM